MAPPPRSTAVGPSDVLFGQACFLRFVPELWSAREPHAPLGALYAAACVRWRGYSVAMFDAMLAESEGEWAEALDRHRPRYAVIYEDSFNYLSKMRMLRVRQAALTMVGAAATRGVTAIVAGPDASDHPATYLDAGARVVVVGEGESTLVDVLDALSARVTARIEDVAGVCLRTADGRLRQTAARPFIRDLDGLPFPAWDLIDVERYRAIWRRRHGYYSMNLATTRGCPYHCNWCAKPIYGQRYATRSPEQVVEEMAWLTRTYRPDHLSIADDIFGLKPGWIERFAEVVRARKAAVPFTCLLRADQITPGVTAALRTARCRTVWIGAESGSQRILDAMEKGTRVDQILTAAKLLHGARIDVGFFLQFGYPGETRDDIARTFRMVRECCPDDIGVSISHPLPGTPFHARVQGQLVPKQDPVDPDDLAMMFRGTRAPEFYRAVHALMHAEFRTRKWTMDLRSVASRPSTCRPHHAGRTLGLPALLVKRQLLRRRVDRLGAHLVTLQPVISLAVLPREAACTPTDQRGF